MIFADAITIPPTAFLRMPAIPPSPPQRLYPPRQNISATGRFIDRPPCLTTLFAVDIILSRGLEAPRGEFLIVISSVTVG